MKEGQFNQNLIKNIRRLGVFCFKTADRFKPGVPDIYVSGGTWIECKVLKLGNQNRTVNLYNKLTPEQKTFCDQLVEAGDNVVIVMRLEFPDENRMLICNFEYLKMYPSADNKSLRNYCLIKSEKEYPLNPFQTLNRFR